MKPPQSSGGVARRALETQPDPSRWRDSATIVPALTADAPVATDVARDEALAARLRLLHRQSIAGMIATFPALLVMTAVLWQAVPTPTLLAWALVALLVNAGRLSLQHRFTPDVAGADTLDTWKRQLILGAALGGLCNGASALLLIHDGGMAEQVFLVLILGGLTAGALSTLSAIYEVYRAYTVMALLSPIVMAALVGTGWQLAVGALLVVYLTLMLRTARHLDASIGRSLALRFENLDLVDTLRRAGERQEAINCELAAEIEQRRIAEEALQREKDRAQVTVESIGDAVITADMLGRIEYLNPSAVAMTGWPLEAARGRALDEVLHLVDEETGERLQSLVERAEGCATRLPGEPVVFNRESGERHSVQITWSPIRDAHRNIVGSVMVLHDITDVRQMARQMSYQATHDPLTGLVNRRELDARLHELFEEARSAGGQHALMFIDLDRFKIVNDTCGHVAGDELLKQIAQVLTDAVRGGDLVARLGGDEFAVLLRSCPAEPAQQVADKLRRRIKELRFAWEQQVFDVGASIGLVPITMHSESVAALLNAADAACYVAKNKGRGRVHVALPGDRELARQRGEVQWVHRLKAALTNNGFTLYRQPAAALCEQVERLDYVEVLLRLTGADGSLAEPRAFMPVAERYQLGPAIDRWVLERVLVFLAAHDTDASLFAVNVCGQSLGDVRFADDVIALFERTGVAPARVCLELTETATLANFQCAAAFVERLRALGCRFALDDFGSGLSSFGYLRTLPFDFLKIEGEFVRDLIDDPVHGEMVRAITQLGHAMGHRIIAESVETAAVRDALPALGVDFAQGYAVCRPAPLEDARAAIAPTR